VSGPASSPSGRGGVPRRGLVDAAVRRVLETLSAADLAEVAAGRARLDVQSVPRPDPAQLGLYGDPPPRPRRQPAAPVPARDHGVDIAAAVMRVNELATPQAVEEYLRDPRFTVPVLRQLARALGPTVLATGRTKSDVRRDIVAGTAGFRTRSAAMSGGAWN
jgi:hypothetical protein